MISRGIPALATVCSLIIAGFQVLRADEPPCTGSTCGTGQIYVNATAVIEVSWNSLEGNMTIMLYEAGAPITTANFIRLATTGFYDGIKFHRCIDDFVAQTGDPNTKNNNPYDDGWGGSGETIPLEINETLTHEDGAVGMARGQDPDSASSQFYICDGAQHQLDGSYAVFGVVVEGLELAKKIAAAPTYGNRRPLLKDHPVDDIVMTSVRVSPGYWLNITNGTQQPPAAGALSGAVTGGAGVAAAAVALAAGGLWVARRRGGTRHPAPTRDEATRR
ncbi:MAG: peptidylprolyl isomerase [Thermoplasmatota archaeon]